MLGFRHYLLGILLAATCSSIICGCDAPENCGLMNGPFGPCDQDSHICEEGLICLDDEPQGTICGIKNGIATEQVSKCAAMFGAGLACNFFGMDCHIACESDDDCLGGTVCSDTFNACVWPRA